MSYNNWYPSSTSPKPLPANNPFLETSAANRFPVIEPSASPGPLGASFASGYQAPQSPVYGQPLAQSPFQFQQYGGQNPGYNTNSVPQQQWTGAQSTYNNTGGYGGYTQPGPPPAYGQLQSPYGYQQQQQQQQQQQYSGYNQFQQQPQQLQLHAQQYQRSLVSEFDPYNNVGALANPGPGSFTAQQTGSSAYSPGQSQQQQSFTTGRTGPSGQQHPRDFIRSHKTELETWNSAAWKQTISIFDDLKRAWENQRADLRRHLLAGQYLTQQDLASLNAMIKSAESNIDSVTAAFLQMQEVDASYKHSSDAASKARVREALNAGLVNLPDWP